MALNIHMTKIIKLVEEKQMCSLPWVHAEVDLQNNSIQPCCKYLGNLGDASDGFSKVWMNENSRELRKNWIDDNPPDECSACDTKDHEFSYKELKNRFYSTKFNFLEHTDVYLPTTPYSYNFSLSNTCNLACRMCGSGHSSKIAQISKKYPKLQKYVGVVPPKKIDPIVLSGSFKNVEFVTFTGGEPLLDDNTIAVIKMIKSESKNLKVIVFATNLTVLNEELLVELDSLDVPIIFNVSIDGPIHIHEYIRYHCSWETMMNNLSYIRKKYPRIYLSVNSTISILNVGYVTDTLDLLNKVQDKHGVGFKSLMTSPVLDKRFLHPGILPQEIKNQYLDKLKSYQGTLTIKDSNFLIPTAIEMLSKNISGEIGNFVDYITQFDEVAGTSVVEVYPEFKSIFK